MTDRMTDRKMILASYSVADSARAALRDLRELGVPDSKIGVLGKDDDGRSVFKSLRELEDESQTSVAAGTAIGTAAGGGGGMLWALGVAAGVLPAIGPIVAGGLLGAILASAGVGAAAGGLTGWLIGTGMGDEEARFVEEEIRSGKVVIVVEDPEDRAAVLRALDRPEATMPPRGKTLGTGRVQLQSNV